VGVVGASPDVLFEDDALLVTNKPPFIDYDSFVAQVNMYLKRSRPKKFFPYLGQMHRLDRETSGILLFTKKKVANTLADQFRDRRIKKLYLAVSLGREIIHWFLQTMAGQCEA